MARKLTERQQKFIDALFADANGNIRDAKVIAGYSPNTNNQEIIQSLKEEILSKAEYYLALHSGKAVQGIVDALEEDGKTPGVNIRMEAAKQILDRVGIVKKDKIDINAQVAHGIFILPAKDDSNKTQS